MSAWPEPEGGWKPASKIGNPITNTKIRELGFEPSRRGWRPLTEDVRRGIEEADARRVQPRPPAPFRIEGEPQPCAICGEPAEPSTVGTATCSALCTAELAEQVLPAAAGALRDEGRAPVRPRPRPKPRRPLPVGGEASIERALERLGSPREVLERHGVRVRGRMAFCPFHENTRTPALSLYARAGKERAHCHACGWAGDVLDLEAALAGEDIATTTRRWT